GRHTIFSRDWSSDVCSSDLIDGRSSSSSCGSLSRLTTRGGLSRSGSLSSSGMLAKLRSSLNLSLPLPPRIRRQPSKRMPAITMMPITISHSRRPNSMKYLTLNNSGEKKIQSTGSQLDYETRRQPDVLADVFPRVTKVG